MQLLLLHGVNNTPNAWLSVRNLLEEHGHECITVFLPASNSVDDIATQILQGLPLGQYWVVGIPLVAWSRWHWRNWRPSGRQVLLWLIAQ